MSQEEINLNNEHALVNKIQEDPINSHTPLVQTDDNLNDDNKSVIQTQDNSKIDHTPVNQAQDDSKVDHKSVIEAQDHTKTDHTPVIETKDNSKIDHTPVIETQDSSKNDHTPVIETQDNSKIDHTLVIETQDNSKNDNIPIIQAPDNSKNDHTPAIQAEDSSKALSNTVPINSNELSINIPSNSLSESNSDTSTTNLSSTQPNQSDSSKILSTEKNSNQLNLPNSNEILSIESSSDHIQLIQDNINELESKNIEEPISLSSPETSLSRDIKRSKSSTDIPEDNVHLRSQQPTIPFLKSQSVPQLALISSPIDSKSTTDDTSVKQNSTQDIKNKTVLVIPLDHRVTPKVIGKNFINHGKIQALIPIPGSSSIIVTFETEEGASACLKAFQNHPKVQVSMAQEQDLEILNQRDSVKSNQIEQKSKSQENSSELSKVALLEMQADRTQMLYKQKQAMQMLREQDNTEWKKRQSRHQVMEKRVISLYKTSQELYAYLNTSVDLLSKYEESLKQKLEPFATTETDTVRQAAVAIDSLQQNRHEQYQDMKSRVFQPAVESASKFSDGLKQQLFYFQNKSNKITNELLDIRHKSDQLWIQYENSLSESLKSQSLGQLYNTDPFLLGKSYDKSQRDYRDTQMRYNEEMSRLFRELVLADGRRIDSMKSILIDYFLAEKAKVVNHVKMIESSLEYIKAIDREKDITEFVNRGEFMLASNTTTTTTNNNNNNNNNNNTNSNNNDHDHDKNKNIFELPISSTRSREISSLIYQDVIKWGTLYRPGKIISTNWKPVHAIITKFGFFHTFNNKEDLKPIASIQLGQVTIILKQDEQPQIFEISVPSTSWISLTGAPTKYLFKSDNLEETIDWVNQLKKHILR